MAKLTEEIKTFVVQRLACFESPSRVVASVKEAYGIAVSRQQVQVYDPTKGIPPAKKWCVLFHATRAGYVATTAAIGVSHRTFRLEALQRLTERAEESGNLLMAKDCLRQAAEEVGDVYTNRRRLDIEPRKALAELLGVPVEDLPAAGPSATPASA